MIKKATPENACVIAQMASKMWDSHDPVELTAEFEALLAEDSCVVFLCMADERPIGFAQCQLRHDYVEGTETSPVGYLEGIFVEEAYRHRGYARKLLTACECWAKEMGCTEFASDCELGNDVSLAFHLNLGCAEANRIICFAKKLK